jgi:hypothetical protein
VAVTGAGPWLLSPKRSPLVSRTSLREGEPAGGGEDELVVLLETLKSTTARIAKLTAKRG